MNKKMLGICLAAAVVSTGTLGGVVASEVADRSLLGANAVVDENPSNSYGNIRLWVSAEWDGMTGHATLSNHQFPKIGIGSKEDRSDWSWLEPTGNIFNSQELFDGNDWYEHYYGNWRPYWYFDIDASMLNGLDTVYMSIQVFENMSVWQPINGGGEPDAYKNGLNKLVVEFNKDESGLWTRDYQSSTGATMTDYLFGQVLYIYGNMSEFHSGTIGSADAEFAATALSAVNTCSASPLNGYKALPNIINTFVYRGFDNFNQMTVTNDDPNWIAHGQTAGGSSQSAGKAPIEALKAVTLNDFPIDGSASDSWTNNPINGKTSSISAWDKITGLYQLRALNN